ncbi:MULTISPECIES: SH3 domain-containing protein [Streptomyces]|uniref:SH3 domain-containing protein n=1 Tax=Streptomyces TaxID=1883 RepID=UPI001587A053|nr:SH3 domain-containing protein [Streptomyces sp. CAI-85]MBO7935805.1 SH3 domain-containing protein [Streptomyces sp. S9]NUV61493.1 SH3 domain-containing protein [Streptomyces sp. CAI-85]
MRTTPALRTLAAALLTGGTLAATALGTTAAEASPTTYTEGHGSSVNGASVRGTVVSSTNLSLRQAPTTHAPLAAQLAPGSHDRVRCMVKGQSVNGNPYWYWMIGAEGWASAAFVDVGRAHVPACDDPCPQWKDGHWVNWTDPFWNDAWSLVASGSFSVSGSFEFSASGTSSGGWEWIPVTR